MRRWSGSISTAPAQKGDSKSGHRQIARRPDDEDLGDKGFDAGWLRERLRANDMEAVIPLREGTSGYAEHDREKYKWRHLVENFFCIIKAFLRIATRYEKTDKYFASMVNLVATVLWTR
jgi:transposase